MEEGRGVTDLLMTAGRDGAGLGQKAAQLSWCRTVCVTTKIWVMIKMGCPRYRGRKMLTL